MDLTPEDLDKLRIKLRYTVWRELGRFCPDADDVVQETVARFLAACKAGKVRKPEAPGAFLHGTCKNVILEYRRRIWREDPFEPDTHDSAQTRPPDAEFMELSDAIDAGLEQMSDRDRLVLRAFYLEERTKQEICQDTGIPEEQFRVILFRAKERLRKILRSGVKPRAMGSH
jgi:RNA polymerase sigma-70 factor (ECF subfamily)